MNIFRTPEQDPIIASLLEKKKTDTVDDKQAKGDFADRDDKDIDNDGDSDNSDKFLHKRRQAIAKKKSKDKSKTADKNPDAKYNDEVDMKPTGVDDHSAGNDVKEEKQVVQEAPDYYSGPGADVVHAVDDSWANLSYCIDKLHQCASAVELKVNRLPSTTPDGVGSVMLKTAQDIKKSIKAVDSKYSTANGKISKAWNTFVDKKRR